MFSSVDPSVISLGIKLLFAKAFIDIGGTILGLFASVFSGGVFDVLIGNVFFDSLKNAVLNKGKEFTLGNIFSTIGSKISGGINTSLEFIYQKVIKKVFKLGSNFKDFFGVTLSGIEAVFRKSIFKLDNIFGTAFLNILDKLAPTIGKVEGIFAPLVSKIGGVFSKIGGIFSKFGSGVAKWFGGFSIAGKILIIVAAIALVSKALTDLYNKNEKFRERVNALWNDTLVPLFDTLKKFWEEHLKPVFTQLGELLSTFYNDIFVPIIGFIAELLMDLLPIFTEVIGTVIEILGPLFDVIGFFIQILKGLLEFISGVFSGDWAKAWEGIKNIFSGVWEAIVAIGKFFANGFIGVINLAIKGIESVLNFVIDGINALLSRVNKAINNVGSLLGKSWDVNLHIGRVSWRGIPYLAEGGIALGPTMAMIGEKGKEAVLPLENNTGWMDALAEKLAAKTKGPSKIVLNVDGKELGYAAINNINSITKQTGSLPLKLA